MTIQQIYASLNDALVADKSPATEYALEQLKNLQKNAIIVMEHNGLDYEDYKDGPVDVVFSEEEAIALCKEKPNRRFYHTRRDDGKFVYA